MQAELHVCLHDSSVTGRTVIVAPSTDKTNVVFRTPQELLDVSFPVTDATFAVDCFTLNPTVAQLKAKHFANAGQQFTENRRNMVVYAVGQRATPRRQLMFGSTATGQGYAQAVVEDAVRLCSGVLSVSCYLFSGGDYVTDLLDLNNTQGLIVDSVKEGPRVRNIQRKRIRSAVDVGAVFRTIITNYEEQFGKSLFETFATPEEEAMPPYNPDSIVLAVHRYDSEELMDQAVDANSMTFIALGDCERPVLCGIDANQVQAFERNQKVISSCVGILTAIRCNRLRIPFGKSRLSLLLKRAYNAEKNNSNNQLNQPTYTVLLLSAFTDDFHAEETFHVLTMAKKASSSMGSIGVGAITRDLSVEKWRLEQDIMELKDELTIARAVHDYRPCIFDQPKPVQNIQEEEQRRIAAIRKKREEAREKAQQEIRARAQEQAKKIIEEEERKSNMKLAELEKLLETRRAENSELQASRAKKIKDFERTLERLRKKKDEEDVTVAQLKEKIKALEDELASRQAAIEKKTRQLEMASLDQARGREAILKERDAIKAQRAKLIVERKQQRAEWIKQIQAMNEKVLAQVQMLAKERAASGKPIDETQEAEETEQSVREDITSIDKYLPKLISLEDNPADVDATESIRKQLDQYFAQEKAAYAKKIEEERTRKDRLEKAVETFRNRILEHQQRQKKDHLQDAIKKEQHLISLVEQVLQYLQHGLRITKVSSKGNIRKRFFFLSEDLKKIFGTELDELGMPLNRKKPTLTVLVKDIKRVVLGMYTPSFCNFGGEAQLSRARSEALRDDGSFSQEPTQPITPQNLGRYNYRAFALMLRGGKTLELVCESDSDCEAWIVAFKRILNFKTPFEKEMERRQAQKEGTFAPPSEAIAEIQWGSNLDVRSRSGINSCTAEEAIFCAETHIPPALFLRAKQDLVDKSQQAIITVYDVRLISTLDLLRSQALYEYLIEKRQLPPPFQA
jgi:hypothetical protein